MNNTDSTTAQISDGRRIEAQQHGSQGAVVMVQPNGSEAVICYMTTVEQAAAEAARIARGINFDIRWMAGIR